MKGKSLNNIKSVQSEYLKRVETMCGIGAAEATNYGINIYIGVHGGLPDHVIKYHYRNLASGISKPVKYINKVKYYGETRISTKSKRVRVYGI